MSEMRENELILLWQESTSAEPNPDEIARLAGRASLRQFDRIVFGRNLVEYAVGLAFLAFLVREIVAGDWLLSPLAFVVTAGWVIYLWWYHRDFKPLDPSSSARAYHAAMLARIDKQIALLRKVRWFGIPLALLNLALILDVTSRFPPPAGMTFAQWLTGMLLGVAIQGVLFLGIIWANERSRWGIPRLRFRRERLEALYRE